jgi:hypothetical protein
MRRTFLCFIVLLATAARAESPAFDQALAIEAGRAYVASYVRLHDDVPVKQFEWKGPVTKAVTYKDGPYDGYVAVFFPALAGSGCGFAVFRVAGPGHLIPFEWGYSGSLVRSMNRFEQIPSLGYPNPSLLSQ